jgi:hypothetical protein
MKEGARIGLGGDQAWAGWKPAGKTKVVAEFEDGSAAVFTSRVGKGIVASFAVDAATAARDLPDVVRDVLDAVLAATGGRRAVDVIGTTENVDLASCFVPGGVRAAVVNHGTAAIEFDVPLDVKAGGTKGTWTDLVTGKPQAGLRRRPGRRSRAMSVGNIRREIDLGTRPEVHVPSSGLLQARRADNRGLPARSQAVSISVQRRLNKPSTLSRCPSPISKMR